MKKIVITTVAILALSSTLMAAVPAACNGCHGADGAKNTMVKESVPNSMKKADIVASLNGYKAGTLNKYGKGMMMKNFAKSLTDADIKAISEAWGK